MYSIYLIPFAIILFITAIIYLYVFARKHAAFMKYMGVAWLFYCLDVLVLMFYMNNNVDTFLEIRKICDLGNILFLMFGTYSLIRVKIPTYWFRFSMYMLLLAIICATYDVELLTFYLPISIFQLILTVVSCYNIIFKCIYEKHIRLITALFLLCWGLYKSSVSIIEVFYQINMFHYATELMLVNLMNISIFIMFAMNITESSRLADNIYKTMLEKSTDAMFNYQFKPYESFKFITPSIYKITGFLQDEFYGNPHLFFDMVSTESRDDIKEVFAADNTYDQPYFIKMTNRNGESFWGEFNRKNIIDKGSIVAMECTLRNVTDLKSAQMEQIKATENRNMLLSYISHELRTPITSIAGYLTAISDGVMSTEEEMKEALSIITTKTTTLKTLIDDLDQLTKLETNQFTFDFMMTNAGEFTEELIAENRIEAESHNFSVEIIADINKLYKYWVIIDCVRIKQVFTNLVTNAYKYASDSHEIIWNFNIDENEQNFVVSVEDFGQGIRSKHLAHIFDKFYRAEYTGDTSKIDGRGLGLTLTKEMILAHNGDIFAESEYGKGSRFTFIIPLYKED